MNDIKKFKSFDDMLNNIPKNEIILNSFIKTWDILNRKGYKNIMCSVSGGRDSDVILDMCYRCDTENKIHYVFFDTGIEYEATKGHLTDLEQKYNIQIERERAKVPVPLAVKRYGVPFLSKHISGCLDRLQKHGFGFDDKNFNEHMREHNYPKYALSWFDNYNYGEHDRGRFHIERTKSLREYILENKPCFKISSECCRYAKKDTSKIYEKRNKIDLVIMGIRKAEGGTRSTAYQTCFYEERTDYDSSLFMPIFWYNNSTERIYEKYFGVENSLCYTVYGFKRTGCACCPYGGKNTFKELEVLKVHEPKLYKAVNNIFSESYKYTFGYYRFREQKQKEQKQKEQSYKTKKNIENVQKALENLKQ